MNGFEPLSIRQSFVEMKSLDNKILSMSTSPAFVELIPILSELNQTLDECCHPVKLNQLAMRLESDFIKTYRFVEQDALPKGDYYEHFIFQHKRIPTRTQNYHDLFNAFVWLLFSQSKTYLNHLHFEQIQQNGLLPRGAIRDRVSHFDECGICLFYHEDSPLKLLEAHAWQELFITHKRQWHRQWRPVIFGHAIYEMLLRPFIGLTAKALCIPCSKDPYALSSQEMDTLLCEYFKTHSVFSQKGKMRPLPLLGIPQWHYAAQDQRFYDNQHYFMPKRQ